MNVVVFDIETQSLAPHGMKIDEDLRNMRVSVACSFDYQTGEYGVYTQDNMPALWYRLSRADMAVGFNIARFDIPVLYYHVYNDLGVSGSMSEALDIMMTQKLAIQNNCFDMYELSKACAGVDKYARGFKCNDHLRALWGHTALKTGDGAEAPKMFQEGCLGDLISYCLGDVHRERRLFEQCWRVGKFKSMGYHNGEVDYDMRRPQFALGLPLDTPIPYPMDDPSTSAGAVVTHAPPPVRPEAPKNPEILAGGQVYLDGNVEI